MPTPSLSDKKARLDELREYASEHALRAFENMWDAAAAEGTTAAWEKVNKFLLEVLPDLKVAQKPDPYANLPVIHMHIGSDMQLTTTVTPAPQPELVEDVTPKSPFHTSASKTWDPQDLDALVAPPAGAEPIDPDQAQILDALTNAASAMALD